MNALVNGWFDMAVKTASLKSSPAFYKGKPGLKDVARPDLGCPGALLSCPSLGGNTVVYAGAGGPAVGNNGPGRTGSAAVARIALTCSGCAFRARLAARRLPGCEFWVTGALLRQLVVGDSSSIKLAPTREGTQEICEPPDMSLGRGCVASSSFFRPVNHAA